MVQIWLADLDWYRCLSLLLSKFDHFLTADIRLLFGNKVKSNASENIIVFLIWPIVFSDKEIEILAILSVGNQAWAQTVGRHFAHLDMSDTVFISQALTIIV